MPGKIALAHFDIRQVENENYFQPNKTKVAKSETLLQKKSRQI